MHYTSIKEIIMNKGILFGALLALSQASVFAIEIGVYVTVDDNMVTTTTSQDDLVANVDQLILEANELYDESNVDIELVPVVINFRDFSFTDPTDLLAEISGANNEFSDILLQADRSGADYIIAMTQLDNHDLCGKAISVNTSQSAISRTSSAIALSDPDCGEDTFVHELGHLMGLAHGDQVSRARSEAGHSAALTNYAKGWGNIVELDSPTVTTLVNGVWVDANGTGDESREQGEFSTLMVGNHVAHWTGTTWNVKVPLFSSPTNFHSICGTDIYGDGIPCGDSANGDAVRALNENRLTYASHESPDVGWLEYGDANLKGCLTANYNSVEIKNMRFWGCASSEIRSLEGIERLTSSQLINLSDNNISVLTPLIKLAKVQAIGGVNLTGNDYAICQQLEELEGLVSILNGPSKCFNLAAMIAVNSLILN